MPIKKVIFFLYISCQFCEKFCDKDKDRVQYHVSDIVFHYKNFNSYNFEVLNMIHTSNSSNDYVTLQYFDIISMIHQP